MTTCSVCLMDDSDPDITFDSEGVCSYCQDWHLHKNIRGYNPNGLEVWKSEIEPKIIVTGKGYEYDCVIGLSGGIDSSYLTYLVKTKTSLNPLLVHVKNDVWNSEISRRNTRHILDFTRFDIIYPTVDMKEYIALQKAYFYASVIDTDVPADYLIEAFIRIEAQKHHIHYVLSGGNYFADAYMPTAWNYPNKLDFWNLMDIYKKYGDGTKLKSFPKFGVWQVLWSKYVGKLKYVTPLNFFGYNRFDAIRELESKIGFEMYKDKHGENIFTRFYQKYVLPTKFGVDKRKANYSNYIRAGGITRGVALIMLHQPIYDQEDFEHDKNLVLSTLAISESEFKKIMRLPIQSHYAFRTDESVYNLEKPYLLLRKTAKQILRMTNYGKKRFQ